MSIRFHSIGSNLSYTCYICREESEEELVAHDGLGRLHAMHKKCIERWAKKQQKCPVCNAEFDSSSFFSWKERMIHRLENVSIKNFIVNTLTNCSSAYMGAFMASSYLERKPEEPPVTLTVVLTASAVGAMAATRFSRAQCSVASCAIAYVLNLL